MFLDDEVQARVSLRQIRQGKSIFRYEVRRRTGGIQFSVRRTYVYIYDVYILIFESEI